jgi:hypothetical protein
MLKTLAKPALLFALSGLVLGWLGNFIPDRYRGWTLYVLAALFGIVLGRLVLPDWTQVCVLGGAAIAAYYIAVRTAVWLDGWLHQRVITYPTAGVVGAVLMTLALCLWRREFRGALPVAIGAGALGGLVFVIQDNDLFYVAGHVVWQVLVGLALVDYGRRKASA